VKLVLSSLFGGLLFGVGLIVSGMTQPEKVFGFLDLTGAWDPSLALVMGGALLVYAIGYQGSKGLSGPLLADSFRLPTRTDMPWQLFVGSALFGVGWAVSGFCPGPALVALGGGMKAAFVFVPAMVAGMLINRITMGSSSGAREGGR